MAFQYNTIDWNLLTRSDSQPVADLDLIERYICLAAVIVKSFRGLGSQA